ncbi:MAG: alcohol dehydrogenase catalytic domain-containing protein [Actinobacteria bacterium]|nr:alcohol dehydrogenase catalytic domain-containing protein [Actinomycetota bacterium]
MRAMAITKISDLKGNKAPLQTVDMPIPELATGELLIKVNTCGVCHTELDEIEGRLELTELPIIPGHQVVGSIVETGGEEDQVEAGGETRVVGMRVGIGWINSACGRCEYCKSGCENLCPEFKATGKDVNGGYSEYIKVSQRYCVPIPADLSDEEASALLCAGAVGYRALRLCNITDGMNLGFLGFGASNHLVLKIARAVFPESKLFVFARSEEEREFGKELGASWCGDTAETSPLKLNAIIDTTPVWKPVVDILKNLKPNGRLVINNIRKEDADKDYLLNVDYARDLWMEKEVKTVANVTLNDIKEVINVALAHNIRPKYQIYDLLDANKAIVDIKEKGIMGAKVLKIA